MVNVMDPLPIVRSSDHRYPCICECHESRVTRETEAELRAAWGDR